MIVFCFLAIQKPQLVWEGEKKLKANCTTLLLLLWWKKLRKTNFSIRKRVRKCKALPQFGTLNKLAVEMGNGRKTLTKRLLIKVFVYN